jgi:hypothetical protein
MPVAGTKRSGKFINGVDESYIITIRKRLLLKVNKATDNGFIGLRV